MHIQIILAVALGGAVGAVGRYLAVTQVGHWMGTGFPYGTLVVNVVGSFIMGSLVEVFALAWAPSQMMRAFLTVGCLGAFTTFSTFSMETVLLVERGETGQAAIYALASVVISVLGFFAGLQLFRTILG
ncbi:fluoride efflux transporter CrcB [Pelagibius sp. Alg239-R121]|uniref:fluoride efflux transporter CrcB n=1 Tax=Pelagibius sp. Alg239-R121 TaxID=2993448 RepID=UPI0024A67165|nr:fluoride efflux transporter CrcB [Pelagibius sp. Alg239-R121]